jgi:hypothetical protein
MSIFRTIKRVASGILIKQLDTSGNDGYTTVSLRLKKEKKTEEKYMVLGLISRGNYQYCSLTLAEFRDLAASVRSMEEFL